MTYAKTALTTKDMPIYIETHDAVKLTHGRGRGADLLAFPECEEYMTSTVNRASSWHKAVIQGISGRFDNMNDITSYNNAYKERYQGTFGDQSIFFLCLTFSLLAFFTLFGFPWLEAICMASTSYMMEFYEDVATCLYPMAICFSISKYFQYKLWNVNDNSGFYFNRLNGMVERRLPDETVSIPFNEFRPLAVQSRNPGGHTGTCLMLFNERVNLVLPFTSCYLADAIICWCYLKQFMDISRPLPDIPEHEATRHLDPTTKTYDEQSGRDPFYWRKKSYKEISKMEEEARQRAKAQFKEPEYFH